MKVAVCDDQKEHLQNIIFSLEKIKDKWNIEYATYDSGEELLNDEEQSVIMGYDLFILDIELPGIQGIELADKLRIINKKALFMFATSFEQYRADAFGMRIVAYITKPVTSEKLNEQFEKNRPYISGIEKFFKFTSDYENMQIKCSEIIYLSKNGRGLTIVTGEKEYYCNMTMKEAVKQLDSTVFAQSHKSYIINLSYLRRIDDDRVVFKNHEAVLLSRNYKKDLRDKHIKFLKAVL